jgi:hypothetical protein
MPRKKTPPLPALPFQGKLFLFDSQVKNPLLIDWVRGRGGIVIWDVEPTLIYLVLGESRRPTPGKSPIERKAAKLAGAKITAASRLASSPTAPVQSTCRCS